MSDNAAEVTTATAIPFGEWPSPVTAELIAAGGVGLGGVVARGTQRWWTELRPTEQGRVVLVCHDTADGATIDVLGAPWSARTRVHEYGGAAWSLGSDSVYFSNWSDQRLYRLADGEVGLSAPEPTALTEEPTESHGWRYADGRETTDGKWFVCVREDHSTGRSDNGGECVNEIVAVATDRSGQVEVLVSGPDFVAAPRISPDGKRLSWFQWNHPNMPWDGTELLVAELAVTGTITATNHVTVAGSSAPGADEAIHGADWLSSGELVFSTDRSGFWNLHRWDPVTAQDQALTALDGAEIGGPAWVFGVQQWTELGAGSLGVVITEAASDSLGILDLNVSLPATPRLLDLPYVAVNSLAASTSLAASASVAASASSLLCLVGSPDQLPSIVEVDSATGEATELRAPQDLGVDAGWFSAAERFDFVSAGGRESHAFLYAPAGPGLVGPDSDLPPLVVMGHGGPTAHTSPDLSLKVQYWTSRGVAVVDVNYGGSTGHGRAYRRLLNQAWGLVDVEDCVAVAEQLAAAGRVDPARMAIRGGSAGGFTVLRALEVSDAFSAGTSLYGVADLEALATETHKFESRYLDSMIGPFPEDKATYDERSPINHTEDLSCPLLVMQGSEDEVVPPAQSEAIVAAVAAKGLAHAYLLFEGEQHGFRQAETIVRSLEAELWFYGKVFGFSHADQIADIPGAVGFS